MNGADVQLATPVAKWRRPSAVGAASLSSSPTSTSSSSISTSRDRASNWRRIWRKNSGLAAAAAAAAAVVVGGGCGAEATPTPPPAVSAPLCELSWPPSSSCFFKWRSRFVCWPKQRSHRPHLIFQYRPLVSHRYFLTSYPLAALPVRTKKSSVRSIRI